MRRILEFCATPKKYESKSMTYLAVEAADRLFGYAWLSLELAIDAAFSLGLGVPSLGRGTVYIVHVYEVLTYFKS